MKQLDLSALGVQEMSQKEMVGVDGGIIMTLTAMTAIWAIQAGICTALILAYRR